MTDADINGLIGYAKDRGVRVVPVRTQLQQFPPTTTRSPEVPFDRADCAWLQEFEMPGHALGFKPIASPGGLEFCDTCACSYARNPHHNAIPRGGSDS